MGPASFSWMYCCISMPVMLRMMIDAMCGELDA